MNRLGASFQQNHPAYYRRKLCDVYVTCGWMLVELVSEISKIFAVQHCRDILS